MAEYVEREDAIRILRGRAVAKYPSSFTLGIFASADELKNMPAADVAPVVHGEWINKTIPYRADVEQRVDCSACKHIFFHTSALTYNYCPNCGADMRGENNA